MARGTRVSIWCLSLLMALTVGATPAGAREGCYPPPCAAPGGTVVGSAAAPDLPVTRVATTDAGGAPALPVVAVAFVMLAGTLTALCSRRRSALVARTPVLLPPAAVPRPQARGRSEPERSLH